MITRYNNYKTIYKNVYGGQSGKGFLVDHHLLLSKQGGNDTELNFPFCILYQPVCFGMHVFLR